MFLVLTPNGSFTATAPPTINVSVAASGDVISSTSIPISDNIHFVQLATNMTPYIVHSAPLDIPYGLGLYGLGPYSSDGDSLYGFGPYGIDLYSVETGHPTVYINITTPASGGTLHYNAKLFGAIFADIESDESDN